MRLGTDVSFVEIGLEVLRVYLPAWTQRIARPSGGWRERLHGLIEIVGGDRAECENSTPRVMRFLFRSLSEIVLQSVGYRAQ